MLSVVVPAYNETGAVGPAVQAIVKVLRDGGIPRSEEHTSELQSQR